MKFGKHDSPLARFCAAAMVLLSWIVSLRAAKLCGAEQISAESTEDRGLAARRGGAPNLSGRRNHLCQGRQFAWVMSEGNVGRSVAASLQDRDVESDTPHSESLDYLLERRVKASVSEAPRIDA